MARTKKKVYVKVGPLELSRRVPVKPKAIPETKPDTVNLANEKKKESDTKVGKSVGTSGNVGRYGTSDTGEYVRNLDGQKGRKTYDIMRRSDPQVQAILKAIGLPIRQAQWIIEPASDSSQDVEIAETAAIDFFDGLSQTWDDVIRHVLLMFPFGFSPLEKIWEVSEGRVRPHDFAARLPQSIVAWKYDDKKQRLIGPVQQDTAGQDVLLPIEKMLIFTNEKEGDNWEGISLLRGAYKPWYMKDIFEKINAIKHDRHGAGIPTLTAPAGIARDTEQWQDGIKLLEDISAQEMSYAMLSEGWVLDILGGNGKDGTDILPTIQYEDEQIARSVLAMFLNLGTTATGSRALGLSFIDLFLLSIQAYADYIAEVFTRFALHEYVDFNWNVTEYPVMKVRKIKKIDPSVIAELKKVGVITIDDATENLIRNEHDLPEKEEGTEREPSQENPDPAPVEDPELSAHVHITKLARRELTDQERLCNLDEIEMQLDTAQETLLTSLLGWRDKQVDKIIIQIIGGKKAHNIVVPFKKEMNEDMVSEFKKQFKVGQSEVVAEINNQIPGKAFANGAPNTEELFELIEEEFDLEVMGSADKLRTMISSQALDLKKTGLTGDALKVALEEAVRTRLSDSTWQKMAGSSVNQGWGAGRFSEMEKRADEIETVYRSGILDGNICDVCRPKDGITHELGDPEFMTPDPECEGTPSRCRCINIAVMKAETA